MPDTPDRLTCPTGKVCLASKRDARSLLRARRHLGMRSAYRCPICGWWHLTHVHPKSRRRYRYTRRHDDD